MGQPRAGVVDFGEARISVLLEGEEFLEVLYGFGCVALLFVNLSKLFVFNNF